MKNQCLIFEDKQENKIEYMQIFNNYQQVIEKYILDVNICLSLQKLTQYVPNFSMGTFATLLATRTDQIDENLLEMINSFTDFQIFKQIMLEYKVFTLDSHKFDGLCIKGAVLRTGP